MASKRRLREAKEKTFRGNSGTDYRARYFMAEGECMTCGSHCGACLRGPCCMVPNS